MKTVWKFPIRLDYVGDGVGIDMPKGAEVLTVQTQGATPCLWALVDDEAPKELRLFHIAGTGHDIGPLPKKYVGSSQMNGGQFVFHVFEVVR